MKRIAYNGSERFHNNSLSHEEEQETENTIGAAIYSVLDKVMGNRQKLVSMKKVRLLYFILL